MTDGGEASDGVDRMSNDCLGQLKAESRVKARTEMGVDDHNATGGGQPEVRDGSAGLADQEQHDTLTTCVVY